MVNNGKQKNDVLPIRTHSFQPFSPTKMRITLHLQPATTPSPPGRGAPTRYRKKLPQTKIELSSHSLALTTPKTYMEP